MSSQTTDPREAMAKRLWDRGFGRDPSVNASNFKAYLAGIPQISASLLAEDADLPFLSLADPRPGLLRGCQLLGIQYGKWRNGGNWAEPFDENFPLPATPFWFRHDDGRKNRNRRPDHCRDELVGDVIAGSATEGIFAYTHNPDIIEEGEHAVDLPRTVDCIARDDCACLCAWDGLVELSPYRESDIAEPCYGALRLRRK